MRRWLVMRVGIWLGMVAIVIGANVLIGGNHFWGLGIIVITGALLAFRIGSMWFMRKKMRQDWQTRGGGRWRGGPGGYAPPPSL
jgi:hypothetical protein